MSTGHRSEPDDVAAILRAVDGQPISRDGVRTAFTVALEAVRNTDDPDVENVITALSALEGDLRGAPERIDARIAGVVQATRSVMSSIESGDAQMAHAAGTAQSGAFDPQRFGAR